MKDYVMFSEESTAARQLARPGGLGVLPPPPALPPSYDNQGEEVGAGIGDDPPEYRL